ncbi:2571_t:CDS:10, partial [Rhizophagus irregularis]
SLEYFQHNEDWSLLGFLEHRKTQKDFKSNKADEHFFYVRNLEYLAEKHENEEYREKAKRYLKEFDGTPIDMSQQMTTVICCQATAWHSNGGPANSFWSSICMENYEKRIELEKLRHAESTIHAVNEETEEVRSISSSETSLLLKRKRQDDVNCFDQGADKRNCFKTPKNKEKNVIHHTTLSYKLVNLFDIPHNQKQRQTRHGRNIPHYYESDKPKGIKRENESATLYPTPPMTEVAESSKNKNAISQYVRDDSSSHKSTPCPTRSVTHTLTPDMTPNKPIINRVQENVNNIHDDEEHAFTLDRNDIPEEELEDSLLQENPGAIVDCKLIINGVCIRLMRYNIIDTTASSATEARKLFEEHWDDIISTVEKFLTSNTVQDGQAEEVKQYIKYISTNVNSAKKLREAIKTERAKLRTGDNIKWKRRALGLMKIFRDQFPNGANYFKEDQTEYDYIIRFISRVYTLLFKDKTFLKQAW